MENLIKKIKDFFNKNKNNVIFWIVISSIFIFINFYASLSLVTSSLEDNKVTYNEFKMMVASGNVKEVSINLNDPIFSFTDKNDTIYITDNHKIDDFKEYLLLNFETPLSLFIIA